MLFRSIITDDLSALVRRVKEVEPDPAKTFGVVIGLNYDKVYEIWGVA